MSGRLLTVKQTSKEHPAFSESSIRFHVFNAEPRLNSRGERIPDNGLASAIIRIGRKVLIDEDRFLKWVEMHRCASSDEHKSAA